MYRIFLILLTFFFSSANAAGVTIDFEEFAVGAIDPPSGDVTSKGYTLDYLDQGAGNPVIEGSGTNGTQTYINCPDCQNPEIIDIYETAGGVLTLLSIDIATINANETYSHEFSFIGTKSGGDTVSKTAISTGLSQTVTFDGSWNNLDSFRIEISPNGPQGFSPSEIDNIVISSVPVPAAAWLFGSALAGLGWLRRKSAA